MTSTIKVNNIQNQCGQNIINENSNTITLGASGDTIALASGASQTGFGRTGTVDWQTSIKTTDFTAVSGEGYFVNTTSGVVIVTLPSSPSAGAIVSVKDYAQTFDSNKCTIARNGSNIEGLALDKDLSTEGIAITAVYGDATKGWQFVNSNEVTNEEKYVTATGGTITTVGNDKIHTFTGPGTFTVCQVASCASNNIVSYMVIAGGAGGGSVASANIGGGGGGAGGYRELKNPVTPYTASPLDGYPTAPNRVTVTATAFPITVGGGGAGGPGTCRGVVGSVSTFSTITSAGGGYGGGGGIPSPTPNRYGGGPGGSGGGASFQPGSEGVGNTPPVTPPQGQNGGKATTGPPDGTAPYKGSGGGGGAGGEGAECAGGGPGPGTFNGAVGGAGTTSSINGTPTVRASGGSAGTYKNPASSPAATPGGGGGGGPGNGGAGSAATANTGGGGGGGGSGNPGPGGSGGAGGSGIVIIRYKFQ